MVMVSALPTSLRDQRRVTSRSTEPRIGKQEIVDLVGQLLRVDARLQLTSRRVA
jgi:hypothetical protein